MHLIQSLGGRAVLKWKLYDERRRHSFSLLKRAALRCIKCYQSSRIENDYMVGEHDGVVRSLTYKVKSPFEANLFEKVISLELKCQ